MSEKHIEQGAFIFREGDVADVAYIVTSGRVELLQQEQLREIQVGIAEAGQAFGEFAIFDPQSLRPYSARATAPTQLATVTGEHFNALYTQCPAEIQPFLVLAFEKMKSTRAKMKVFTQGALEGDISKISILPDSDKMKAQFAPIQVSVGRLPFRIGGFPEDGEMTRRDQLHLSIASQVNPLRVSRQHCEIVIENGVLSITDLGSRFCTIVNGAIIGRGHGLYNAPLKKGDNTVVLGASDSQYRFIVQLESAKTQ